MAETNSGTQARPYSKPTLTVYGKVADITKANNTTGMQDNPVTRTFTAMH